MGYWIQIFSDDGTPLFEASKNYPDVSFAARTPFYGLIISSLKHGFVPGIVRSDDAAIALAAYGPREARLILVMVTSELSMGQTEHLEERMQWRLATIYRGACSVVGAAVLEKQERRDVEQAKRLFFQRLTPLVLRLMIEDPAPGLIGRVPRLALTLAGTAVELLPNAAAHEALRSLAEVLEPGDRSSVALALSCKGRLLAATPAWLARVPLDQALLLAVAEQVGPATFDQPSRSFLLEEVDNVWLPSKEVAAAHGESDVGAVALASMDALPLARSGLAAGEIQQFRLLNLRLYPPLGCLNTKPCAGCAAATSSAAAGAAPVAPLVVDGQQLPAALAAPLLPEEAAAIGQEECSLVLSMLEQTGQGKSCRGAAELQVCTDMCRAQLERVWPGANAAPGSGLLRCGGGELDAAVLIDEHSQEVLVQPSAWHRCSLPPWQCLRAAHRSSSARRLLYWVQTLPPLCPDRRQQYMHSEGYALAGVRRDDGLCCWGLISATPLPGTVSDPDASKPLPGTVSDPDASKAADVEAGTRKRQPMEERRVLGLVLELSERIPSPVDLTRVAMGEF